MPLEQVLAKAMQDVQGQLGTYDIYYLDQSWVAAFAQHCVDPVQLYNDKPELAMPDFDFDDFCRPWSTARYRSTASGWVFRSTSRFSSSCIARTCLINTGSKYQPPTLNLPVR